MLKNDLKERMKNGESTIGLVSNLPSSQLTQIFGIAGFDFVIFDMEHSSMSYETLENLVNVAKLYNITPLVRIPDNEPKDILRTLDSGCLGVMVPQIDTKEEAQRFIDSTKYPPEGIRGTNWKTVAANFGDYNTKEYMKSSNNNLLRIIQIETKDGFENIEEIIEVEDIDVVMIGASDLSASMGYPGDPGKQEVQEAIDFVVKRCKEANIIVGGGGSDNKEDMIEAQEKGIKMFFANPGVFISNSSKSLVAAIKDTFI